MAGLVPAIHVFTCCEFQQTWMPGTSPGMTLLSRLAQSSSTCDSACNISFGRTHGANKAADHLRILDAGRAFDARGNIDAAGSRNANGFSGIAGIQATPVT